MTEKKAYITKDGYDKLKKELEQLKTVRRKEVAQRIEEAKDFGDISENSEYEEAKNEQAFVEGKIAELSKTLKHAQVKEVCTSNQYIEVGCTVILQAGNRTETYHIVGSAESDPGASKISSESPLGNALMSRQAGDKVLVKTPKGDVEYVVAEIKA